MRYQQMLWEEPHRRQLWLKEGKSLRRKSEDEEISYAVMVRAVDDKPSRRNPESFSLKHLILWGQRSEVLTLLFSLEYVILSLAFSWILCLCSFSWILCPRGFLKCEDGKELQVQYTLIAWGVSCRLQTCHVWSNSPGQAPQNPGQVLQTQLSCPHKHNRFHWKPFRYSAVGYWEIRHHRMSM